MLYLILILFLSVFMILTYSKEKKGYLKTITKDNLSPIFDESHNYKLKIPIFKKEAKYNRKIKSGLKIKKEELIKIVLNAEETQIVITDIYYNIIYKINNPIEVNLCSYDMKNTYKIEDNKNYLLFIRYNPMYEDNFKYSIKKYKHFSKVPLLNNTELQTNTLLNETNLYDELEKNSIHVIRDMKKNKYIIENFKYSESYISLPSNELSNKLSYKAQKDETIVMVTTNKKKMGCLNHVVEINTNTTSFNWYPDCDKLFCTFVIDNDIDDNNFIFYDRVINLDTKSDIIPFKLLIFTKEKVSIRDNS